MWLSRQDFSPSDFKTRCSVAERSVRARRKGGKLSESREKRDEFLTPPRADVLRGDPKAKLLGAFESSLSGSTATLFGSLRQAVGLSATPFGRQRAKAVNPFGIDSMNNFFHAT